MTAFLSDSYLLLIVLIITVVSLFLCLYTALLLFDVSKRITGLMRRYGIQPGTTGGEQMPADATSFEEIRVRDSLQEHEDIVKGIKTVAEKYHIDSLVVAMPDGLVVASAGNSDPEYDAAHFSNLFTGSYTMPDKGVWLFPLDHRGVPLIGIARSDEAIKKERSIRMAEEIKLLIERGLCTNIRHSFTIFL
jgi:hypothetical protein